MIDWLTDFLAEFKPLAASNLGVTWPPVAGTISCLTTIQGVQHNFLEMINGTAPPGWTFALPGFIIDVGKFTAKPEEFCMNTQSLVRQPLGIVLIQEIAPGTQNTVNEAMTQLKLTLDSAYNYYNTFTRVEQGQLISNVTCPINKDLLSDSEVDVICAGLFYDPGFLVQMY